MLKQKNRTSCPGLHFLIIFIIAVFALSVGAQIKAVLDTESSHILSIVKSTPHAAIPISPVTGFNKSSAVTNRGKTFKAFVLCLPNPKGSAGCGDHIFITDTRTKMTYTIVGEPDLMQLTRPVDELKWIGPNKLSYERWAQPHLGHRYVVDVKTRKQLAAFILSDK